jgi:MFS transporter, DHA3 family, macrolide efflux protein
MKTTKPPSVLRDPGVARVAAARFISSTGGEAAFFVGMWGKATYEFDATPGELAFFMAVLGVCSLAGFAAAGVLVDRYDPRRVLMVGEVFFVPAALAMVLPDSIGDLTLVGALVALLGAVVMTAVASFAPYLTEDDDRLHHINAVVETGGSLAFVSGPAVGALLVRYASLDWIFVVDALTSLVAVAVVGGVVLRAVEKRARRTAVKELVEGFRFTYTSRPLRLYVLVGAAVWLSFGAFAALEPLFYREVLEVGPEALGWVNAVFGIALIGGSLLLDRLPPAVVSARVLTAAAVVSGLSAVIYTATDDMRVVVAGVIVWGIDLGIFLPLVRTLVQLDTPDGLVGRITGTAYVHNEFGQLLPLTFVAVLAGAFGIQPVLIGSGVLLMIAALMFGFPEARKVDRMRRKPPAAPRHLEAADKPITPNP